MKCARSISVEDVDLAVAKCAHVPGVERGCGDSTEFCTGHFIEEDDVTG